MLRALSRRGRELSRHRERCAALLPWRGAVDDLRRRRLLVDDEPLDVARADARERLRSDAFFFARDRARGLHAAAGVVDRARVDPTPPPSTRRARRSVHDDRRASSSSSTEDDAKTRAPSPSSASSSIPAPEAEHTWVDRALPPALAPYAKLARIDRPVGVYLLMWPCFWSIAVAAAPGAAPDPTLLALFGAGSVLLRGAGCTINDMWDKDIDKLVARTRNRPIASGAVSPAAATAFLGAQLGAGLAVLLQLNDFSKLLGASSLALVATYPLMKRITNWPQAFLGLTFNWGALLGYAAVHGTLDPYVTLPLYLSAASWTLLYDTIYAHQDKDDDARVGVKSTALHFGDDTKKYLAGFGALSTAGLLTSGAAAGLGAPFYLGVSAAAAHLAWQVRDVDLDDRDDCARKFKSNGTYGVLVFAAIVAGKLAGAG